MKSNEPGNAEFRKVEFLDVSAMLNYSDPLWALNTENVKRTGEMKSNEPGNTEFRKVEFLHVCGARRPAVILTRSGLWALDTEKNTFDTSGFLAEGPIIFSSAVSQNGLYKS